MLFVSILGQFFQVADRGVHVPPWIIGYCISSLNARNSVSEIYYQKVKIDENNC